MQKKYEQLMRKCISLAKKGIGKTSPNPLVGSIIFDDDFRIISTGFHEKYGENHAERNAILNAKENLNGKSLIVNLEPCSHYGKTPPCSDLIIKNKIKRVIYSFNDPNTKVYGEGRKKLEKAGIEVIVGILEKECKELNKIFLKNQIKKLPYITIKTATTLDGKIATSTGSSQWITDETSRKEVQKLRNQYDAILTSSKTVIKDNPSLTCRMKNGKNPIRIIIDTNLTTSPNSKVYNNDGTKVFIITGTKQNYKKYPDNVEIIYCPPKNNHCDIKTAIELLFNKGIMSILIECGGTLNKAFIENNAVDEIIQFIAPKILGDSTGINFVEGFNRCKISDCNNFKFHSVKKLKNDIMITLKNFD